MSVHLCDRQLLAELIRLAEAVLGRRPSAVEFDLDALADDILAARRCPDRRSRFGVGEAVLFASLQTIATGGAATGAELMRFAFIAQQALAIVREHYFAIVKAEAVARARGEGRP